MASNSRLQMEMWLKKIDVHADRVLDVGGAQNPIIGRTRSWFVRDYKILDLEQPHETKHVPDYTGDLNYPVHYDMDIGQFDVIFCLEVMEYLWFPLQALYNMAHWLKPNGILYLSSHFIYKIHPPEGADYVRYTPDGIEKLLNKGGFKIIEHNKRVALPESTEILQRFFEAERMRGKTKWHNNIVGSLIKCQKI